MNFKRRKISSYQSLICNLETYLFQLPTWMGLQRKDNQYFSLKSILIFLFFFFKNKVSLSKHNYRCWGAVFCKSSILYIYSLYFSTHTHTCIHSSFPYIPHAQNCNSATEWKENILWCIHFSFQDLRQKLARSQWLSRTHFLPSSYWYLFKIYS